MKQQCYVAYVYLGWAVLLGGFIYLLWRGQVFEATLWIPMAVGAMWLYIRYFPSVSALMGYGSVADREASTVPKVQADVHLYTGLGCPFCPIVKRRLQELEEKMGFHLKEIDVTLKPEILMSKGIKALPVIEVGDRRIVGNATSADLASFILSASPDGTAA
jgi:glutaredoxin